MYMTKMALDKLGNKNRAQLDRLVDTILGTLRSSERQFYPRFSFTKGFSKVSMITSDEWAGKLFVLLLIAHTAEGHRILCHTFDKTKRMKEIPDDFGNWPVKDQISKYQETAEKLNKAERQKKKGQLGDDASVESDDDGRADTKPKEKEEELLRKCNWEEFVQVAEALLCFHAWYKLDSATWFSETDPKHRAKLVSDASRKMLAMVLCYMPRKTGLHWKIQKFHDITHLAEDMRRFGSPKNFEAGFLESSLRYWAKLPAMTSQTRGYNEFLNQVSSRLLEFQCFAKALRENNLLGVMDKQLHPETQLQQPSKDAPATMHGSCFRVYADKVDTGMYQPSEYLGKSIGYSAVSSLLEDYLRESLEDSGHIDAPIVPQSMEDGQRYWDVYTECTFIPSDAVGVRANGMMLLRAHPNYCNEGPWFDWAMINFGEPTQDEMNDQEMLNATPFYKQGTVPCKILGFVRDGHSGEVLALVQPCEYQNADDLKASSVLLESWRMQYMGPTLGTNRPRRAHPKTPDRHQPFIQEVHLETIHDRCLVVQEYPGINCYLDEDLRSDPCLLANHDAVLLVRNRRDWGLEFVDSCA